MHYHPGRGASDDDVLVVTPMSVLCDMAAAAVTVTTGEYRYNFYYRTFVLRPPAAGKNGEPIQVAGTTC